MSDGSSFSMKSQKSDRNADDLGPANKPDPVIDTVRNLIKEESAAPARRNEPDRIDVLSPSRKHGAPAIKHKTLDWFRSAVRFLVRAVTSFFQWPGASRILAILMLCIIAFINPWLVVSLVLLGVMLALIIYFSLGPDKVGALVAAWHTRLLQQDPTKAEVIRRRAARWSKRISTVIDRLPSKWTAGLYLPDFEKESELPEKMGTDPFDRLNVRNIAR